MQTKKRRVTIASETVQAVGPPGTRRQRRKPRLTRYLVALAGTIALPFNPLLKHLYPGPVVTRHNFELAPAHKGLGGLRLLFISDLHVGSLMTRRYLENVVATCNRLAPHIMVLGGDLISGARAIDELAAIMAGLAAPKGCVAIRGNHDVDGGERLGQALAASGIDLMINRGRRIAFGDTSLWLAAVDDLWYGRPDLEAAVAGRRPGEFTLLLSHNPDFIGRVPAAGVELMISGHTHGGQIRLLGRPVTSNSRYGMTYLEGWNHDGPCPIYVSRGIGTVQVALRIGARPEITVIDFA